MVLKQHLSCFCLVMALGLAACDSNSSPNSNVQPSMSANPVGPMPSPTPTPVAIEFQADQLPAKIDIQYRWSGLAQYWPRESYQLSYLTAAQSYQAAGNYLQVSSSEEVHLTVPIKLQLPQAKVQNLIRAVAQASWRPASEPARELGITDHYPDYKLSFTSASGQTVELFSNSNSSTLVPWNLRLNQNLYTTHEDAVGKAVLELFAPIREYHKQEI